MQSQIKVMLAHHNFFSAKTIVLLVPKSSDTPTFISGLMLEMWVWVSINNIHKYVFAFTS